MKLDRKKLESWASVVLDVLEHTGELIDAAVQRAEKAEGACEGKRHPDDEQAPETEVREEYFVTPAYSFAPLSLLEARRAAADISACNNGAFMVVKVVEVFRGGQAEDNEA